MKFPAMFDQNPPLTLDQIVEKTHFNEKLSQTLTFSPNVKVIAKIKRYQPGQQKTCHL